jgi:hypothetical protein
MSLEARLKGLLVNYRECMDRQEQLSALYVSALTRTDLNGCAFACRLLEANAEHMQSIKRVIESLVDESDDLKKYD